jgi:hypothetical protein
MTGALETTMDLDVKSRPVESLAVWHSTQYLAKNPCAQLFQVSPFASICALESLALPLAGGEGFDVPDEEQAAAPAMSIAYAAVHRTEPECFMGMT